MTFRKQSRYYTDQPAELARQLVALENAIAQALEDAKAETFPRGQVYNVREDGTVALVGNMYRCDTSPGNFVLKLEKPTSALRNTFVVVVKTQAANTLTLEPIDALINGANTTAVTSLGAYAVYCDGESYWREF